MPSNKWSVGEVYDSKEKLEAAISSGLLIVTEEELALAQQKVDGIIAANNAVILTRFEGRQESEQQGHGDGAEIAARQQSELYAERVERLRTDLARVAIAEVPDQPEVVAIGTLVTVKITNTAIEKSFIDKYLLVGGGDNKIYVGLEHKYDDQGITLAGYNSALVRAIIGLKPGDTSSYYAGKEENPSEFKVEVIDVGLFESDQHN